MSKIIPYFEIRFVRWYRFSIDLLELMDNFNHFVEFN